MVLIAGGATRVINCEIGDDLAGMLNLRGERVCEWIHDDLEANAFFISDEQESLLLISCDLLGLERGFIDGIASIIEVKVKIPAKNIIVCCTHTHNGPHTFQTVPNIPPNEKYLERLKKWLVDLAEEAVSSAKPARIGWALGHAQIGYNRRVCWENGSHTMYGDTSRLDFTGLEGPDDPSHTILFAVNEKNEILALALNNSCHPVVFCAHNFVSADFPGITRSFLRSVIGSKIPILYLQGASGDISPWNLLDPSSYLRLIERNAAERLAKKIGFLLTAETLRLIDEAKLSDKPTIRSRHEDINIAVRMPTEEELAHAREVVEMGVEKAGRWDYVLQYSILRLYEEFKEKPFDTIPIHVARVGDFAIATNPCELYCQFGLDIKRRSPAKVTAVVQLANGCSGYCPTAYGILGGGYSGDKLFWCRLEPFAGYRIVEVTTKLLYQIWKNQHC
jgi:hypothetical protein